MGSSSNPTCSLKFQDLGVLSPETLNRHPRDVPRPAALEISQAVVKVPQMVDLESLSVKSRIRA